MAGMLVELGVTGLEQFSGRIHEEWLDRLRDERGRRTFREMSDNDPTIGAILFAVEMLMRTVSWRVDPWSDDPLHVDRGEFVESLMDDMSHTWSDFIAESMSMLPFGFAPFELVYKRRLGPFGKDPKRRSRHTDGLIGWRKLAIRAQETVDRWEIDEEDGGLEGLHQCPPTGGPEVFIPIEKLLIFRTTSRKGNPEGRSILRNAFVPWWYRKHIAESEAIGIERDLTGIPVFWVPPALLNETASAEEKANLAEFKKIVQNLKVDEQAGMVLPLDMDENGNERYRFELVGTGSRRLFDTNAIISRYKQEIATVILADFILLGHEQVGSFALSSDKTSLFATALGTWLQEIASVLNRHAIPRVYELNGWDPSETAQILPSDIEKAEIEKFARAMADLTGAGHLTPGDAATEAKVREMLDLPDVTPEEDPGSPSSASAGGAEIGASPQERKDPAAALNGAQVTAMVKIVSDVAAGLMPRDSGVQIIAASFPITMEQAELILGSAGNGFSATPPPPKPEGGGAPDPEAADEELPTAD